MKYQYFNYFQTYITKIINYCARILMDELIKFN